MLPGAPDNGPPRALRSGRVRIVSLVRIVVQRRVEFLSAVVQGRRSALVLYLKPKDIATDPAPETCEFGTHFIRMLWMIVTIAL